MIDPLTHREIDVLRLMAEEFSAAEMAERLHLAPNTVKWYTQQIYGKLGIEGAGQKRDRAVARARTLGLLQAERTPGGRLRYNLPAQTTPLVGRIRELDDVMALLVDPNVRLVTLLAPGGMGKTRLALEVAWRLVEPEAFGTRWAVFPDGAYFAPLQAIDTAEDILRAIAEAVDYSFQGDGREPLRQLLDFFREKRLLLVLDNFEHILEGAVVINDILQAAPAVQIVVTSREALRLTAETVYTVKGLPFPRSGEDIPHFDAARLFLEGARRTRASFNLQPDDYPHVAYICSLVDGMPLALLLAAAWVDVLSVQEIAEEIAGSLEFLATEMRDVPQRQWSIRAVFEPTWQRLSDEERAVFMRLAVFRSGCARQSVQAVTGASLASLQSLVNKAIVSRTPLGRYEIHELLRQYAQEHLEAAGETEAAGDAHCAYYAMFMHNHEDDLKGGDRQIAAYVEIDAEFENVRAAWQWAIEHRRIDLLAQMEWPVWHFLVLRNRPTEGMALFQQGLEQEDDRARRGRQMGYYSVFCSSIERNWEAENWARQSLAIARETGNTVDLAYALRQMAVAEAGASRDFAKAHQLADESLALFRALGDPWGLAWGLHGKGFVAGRGGDNYAAIAFTEEAIRQARIIGNRWRLAAGLLNLGVYHGELGEPQIALHYFEECLAVARELKARTLEAMAIGQVGRVAHYLGKFGVALEHYDKAGALGREYGQPRIMAYYLLHSADVLSCVGKLDEAAIRLAECTSVLQSIESEDLEAAVSVFGATAAYRIKDYAAARRLAHDGLEYARSHQLGPRESECRLLLGLAEIMLGDLDAARRYMRASLTGNAFRPHLTRAVVGLAGLAAAETSFEDAVELAVLAREHRATEYEFKVHADELLAELQALLSPEVYAAAVERGAALDLDEVIKTWMEENQE